MKRTKNQGFGYFAKNQMNSAENLQTCSLRSLRTMDIFYATFIDFLNASSPMPIENIENQHLICKKDM
ncbi:hypothetical protein ACILDT_04885 [Capnocytophaga canis]|uniref:hypothetical protein n=1 Tax=Capnocytophaga TaxID=1016 RepID=UPI000BB1EBC4|nr:MULTISPECIES: hypothetical protein [Capnocytophaga]ATA75083.1 hypothetical protein CGC52_06420 [Capnocytophaga sp. H2931]